jgi:5-oxoprolinase (ATP-hydrolysing)
MIVEAVSVEAVVAGDAPAEPRLPAAAGRAKCRAARPCACTPAAWHEAALVVREDLRPAT